MEDFFGTIGALLVIIAGGLIFFFKDKFVAHREEIKRQELKRKSLEEWTAHTEKYAEDMRKQTEKELNNASNEEIIDMFHNAFSTMPDGHSTSTKTSNDEDSNGPDH